MILNFDGLAAEARRRTAARDRLLDAADSLFYRQGIRAVGVDKVVNTAGVAKISLYRSFPSKDDLIVAYLERRDEDFWRVWEGEVAVSSEPRAQLRAIATYFCRTFENDAYRGCPLANFAAEFPEKGHPGRRVVERSKRELRRRLTDLCVRADLPEAEQRAGALALAVEGAISLSQTADNGGQLAAISFAWTAKALLAP